jgi:hypothetical protein
MLLIGRKCFQIHLQFGSSDQVKNVEKVALLVAQSIHQYLPKN